MFFYKGSTQSQEFFYFFSCSRTYISFQILLLSDRKSSKAVKFGTLSELLISLFSTGRAISLMKLLNIELTISFSFLYSVRLLDDGAEHNNFLLSNNDKDIFLHSSLCSASSAIIK